MAAVFSDTDNIFGGTKGALQTDFPTSVTNVFSLPPKAAMVIEGDFVPGAATKSKAKPITDYNQFPFPSVNGSAPSVVARRRHRRDVQGHPGGARSRDLPGDPEAATIWAKRGGFSSPNKGVPASAYPDAVQRATATALAQAKIFRFDMSDLAPSAFGGTPGQGEWKILQDFLKNPSDIDGTASKLETAAAAAYK